MSELLQDDDPDPQPNAKTEYPINWETNLAFDDFELAAELTERESVYYLSQYADKIIESELSEGEVTKRRIITDEAQLYRTSIGNGTRVYAFYDTLEGRTRCRAWKTEDVGVSWCEDEQRYEPADEVLARLELVFPIGPEDESLVDTEGRIRHIPARLKRQLAMAITRLAS